VLFLVVLFLIRNTAIFKNTVNFVKGNQENGLTYGNITIEDLVSKDSDSDGIVDWQEPLYGLDPTKKETTPGIPDSTAISKLQAEQGESVGGINKSISSTEPEKLTKTEQFSRELFATVAAGSQSGAMDQTMVNALGASLATKIENPVVRKVFTLSDIKITNDDSSLAIINYLKTMNTIANKYPIKEDVLSILQKFVADENNLDMSALAKLDLVIKPIQSAMEEGLKINVPQSLAQLHLDCLNGLERVIENLNDIRLFDTDPIVTMGAINQVYPNAISLGSAVTKLQNVITQKLLLKN